MDCKDNSWMKKIFIFVVIVYFGASNFLGAQAKSIVAQTTDDFDLANPSKEFSVKILEDTFWDIGKELEKDAVLKGKVVQVIPPQRLKKDAYFVFKVKSFTVPSEEDKVVEIKYSSKTDVRLYTPVDKAQIAGKVAVAAVGTVIKGIGYGVDFVQGAIKAEDGENKFKAGAHNVYENSPLSYCRKGSYGFISAGSFVKFSLDEEIFEE